MSFLPGFIILIASTTIGMLVVTWIAFVEIRKRKNLKLINNGQRMLPLSLHYLSILTYIFANVLCVSKLITIIPQLCNSVINVPYLAGIAFQKYLVILIQL